MSGIFDVDVMHDRQQIDVNPGAAQHVKCLNDLLVSRLLAFGDPVVVVQLAGTVQAEPDVKIFFGEEFAPFIVDRRAVGLDAVDDFLLRR